MVSSRQSIRREGRSDLAVRPFPQYTPSVPTLLRAEHISKRFGITQALDDVSVEFAAGEIHALMGENGAGKSTLGKVIAGLHRQDQGTVTIFDGAGAGRQLRPGSIDDAFDSGVRIVHQELAQCPNLTVAENLNLHDIPTKFAFLGRGLGSVLSIVDRRTMAERAARLVHRLEPGIDVEAPLGSLPPGWRQIVQIAASLDERHEMVGKGKGAAAGESAPVGAAARVIVFDEPTSSLSISETDRLLGIIRQLARDGITIIYVSHRMGEIFACCDRVSVLRDGKFVATSVVKDIDEPTLVEQMIGRRLELVQKRTIPPALAAEGAAKPPRLEVRGLNSPGKLANVGLSVRAGEILGLGGLVGSGRSEVLDAIFGLDPRASGDVLIDARPVARTPDALIGAKVGYVPEDRRLQGLFFDLGIDENILVPFMHRIARALGIRHSGREKAIVWDKVRDFQVKAASTSSQPGELSGGNQQKLLIARWLGKDTSVILLDEPTRGIDVGTKAEVYRIVREAADRGLAVLLVSSEMPELLALSDRILVMNSGRIAGELTGEEMTQTNILRLATKESGRVGAA
jgi:ABC-type sugar transport system ATPase subunit